MKTAKRLLVLILCFMLISSGLSVFADSISVRATASAVLVNGESVEFDAYNIAGNNYFKLRDLAYALNGTNKQFEVGWDGEANAITLTSGEAYTPVGGEMLAGSDSRTAIPSAVRIYLDGREINMTAYNIAGNNYFKLRDLGQAIDFGVDWDSARNMIIIDTSKNYWSMETQDIIINPGDEFELPGTLTVPVGGEGPFPLVIIVHGSGPGNRDGEMGPAIKVYRDLAEQLASHGIASIRYDKRTRVHGQRIAADVNFTVKEETIYDVIFAAELALQLDNIDKDKIYVAGHSLSGYLVPRIFAADINNIIAGYIFLAGNARPLTELVLEQLDYLFEIDPAVTDAVKVFFMNQIQAAVDAVLNLTEADRGTAVVMMEGIIPAYPSYWLDLADYDPLEEIKNVDAPLLFLQGSSDYQITEVDFNLWKTALEGRENATFILYQNLTHAFTFTEQQKGTPADYMAEATVDARVARDIADFIKNN